MTFENSILAGETLVRDSIQSENYVAGSSGWSIDRNGNAEFNNVDLRGILEVYKDGQLVGSLDQDGLMVSADGNPNTRVEIDTQSMEIKFYHDGSLTPFKIDSFLYDTDSAGIQFNSPAKNDSRTLQAWKYEEISSQVTTAIFGVLARTLLNETGFDVTHGKLFVNGQQIRKSAEAVVNVAMTGTATPPWGGSVNRGSANLSFPAGRFDVTPIVTATPLTGFPSHRFVGVSNITTTGCTITVDNSGSGAVDVQVIASEDA